jgi:hypothetical protein
MISQKENLAYQCGGDNCLLFGPPLSLERGIKEGL